MAPAKDARSRPAVGRNLPRTDAAAKANGSARYIDDLHFPNMLWGRTVRSTVPRGRIRSIDYDFPAEHAGDFVVVDCGDIPGENYVAMIENDQPCLAASEIHHMAEPVILLAHHDREALLGARVTIDYEESEAQYDPLSSSVSFKDGCIRKGDVAQGFAAADLIVEGTYRTGHQEQVYIEPQGMIAVPEDGGMTVYGSMQCPHYVHRAVAVIMGLSEDNVRIVQTETGGGFGGKEEYPSMIAAHAALLAHKANRPVKLIYDRSEDMVATTKRHPAVVRHRTGVTRDGRLTAVEIDVVLDGGAYVTLSPVVLSRGLIHATGPYRCDHILVSGRAAKTNTPPNGAFRGFGAPQTQFAAEVHMDRIAEALGLDPVEVRRKNALRPGDTTATGHRMDDSCSALEVLEEAVNRSDFARKRREYGGTDRGIGLALFFHGSGFTGRGETYLASKAALELTENGVRILVGSTEIGQGTRTMHAQIVAECMGIDYRQVEVAQPDTALVPDSGPTVASRTTMVVGEILARCAREIKGRLGTLSPGEYLRQHGPLVVTKEYQHPSDIEPWDEANYRGAAYAAYGWSCDVAEVHLDRDTYEVRPLHFTAVNEVGKAIHPVMVAGQIEGGSAQGIGFALNERVVMDGGIMANASLTNYTIPTTLDTPPMDIVVMEKPYRHGPFGAKGVGEMPIDGPAPAVVNAIRQLGVDVRDIPAVPESIMEAVCKSS